MAIRQVSRQKAKLRIGLAAPSGFGKTYSALLLAKGLASGWNKICIIDSENGSADFYQDLGDYNVNPLTAPYSPEAYINAIKECEDAGMEVIIIDSITHEWDGKGGCLEIVESLGGRYQDWAKVTPRHQKFIDAVLQSKCHVITTVRKKQDYEMSKDNNGKLTVQKAGLKEITREGFEYELTLSFNIENKNHLATASKDRTGLFDGKPEFVISGETGQILKTWAENGTEPKIAKPVVDVTKRKRTFALAHEVFPEKADEDAYWEKAKAYYKVESRSMFTNENLDAIIESLNKKKGENVK